MASKNSDKILNVVIDAISRLDLEILGVKGFNVNFVVLEKSM